MAISQRGPRPTAQTLAAIGSLTKQQRRLFDEILAHPHPLSIAEIAQALAAHPNTVREHLARLEELGLVDFDTEAVGGRGRPKKVYRARSSSIEGPAQHLVGLIVAALRTLEPDQADAIAYDWGMRWGQDIMQAEGADLSEGSLAAIGQLMVEMGFAPEVAEPGRSLELRQCPLLSAGTDVPPGLCSIHRGMIDTIVAASGENAAARLVPFATPRSCLVEVSERE